MESNLETSFPSFSVGTSVKNDAVKKTPARPLFSDEESFQKNVKEEETTFPNFDSKSPQNLPKQENRSSSSLKPKDRVVLKVIVLGTSNVGKTSLMKRYVASAYTDLRRPTTGADFMTRQVIINEEPCLLQIWDTAGQERFHHGTLGHPFYRGADGALLVYDVSQPKSFDQIAMWREELLLKVDPQNEIPNHKFPIVVVGNKIDLAIENYLSGAQDEAITAWCQDQGVGHILTSAKEGIGVEAAMQAIAQLALLNKKLKQERESSASFKKQEFVDIAAKFEPSPKKKCCL